MTQEAGSETGPTGTLRASGTTRAAGPRVLAAVAVTSLVAAALLAGLLTATQRMWVAVSSPGPATLDEVLGLVAAAAATVLVLWWAAGTLVAVGGHLRGRPGAWCHRLAARSAPALSHRVAAVLVGVSVGGVLSSNAAVAASIPPSPAAPTTTAGAMAAVPAPGWVPTTTEVSRDASAQGGPGWSPTPAPRRTPPTAATGDAPSAPTSSGPSAPTSSTPTAAGASSGAADRGQSPGWTPSRPLQRPQAPAEVLGLRPGARTTADEVVVHRGDTLWSIVARRLGPDASDAEVAAAWPAWHQANRAVIGDDPDLLVPGQQLRAPAATVAAR